MMHVLIKKKKEETHRDTGEKYKEDRAERYMEVKGCHELLELPGGRTEAWPRLSLRACRRSQPAEV